MTAAGTQKKLDPNQSSKLSKLLLQQFSNKVVGQKNATDKLVDVFDAHTAGISDSGRPAGTLLFLGPTGTGKTHVVEMFAESLFGNHKAHIRVDCAEFQHSHEIAKLLGSPPGYLGHRETHPTLTQAALNQWHTSTVKFSIVLFDEIEKASDALWSLLLGILDNATLTLGDNSKVDFSNSVIIMTSNLGAREMANRGLGYVAPIFDMDDERKAKVALSAAKSKFSPEFINRIQHTVTFKTLTKEQISQVLEMELSNLSKRIFLASSVVYPIDETKIRKIIPRFSLVVSPAAKRVLLDDGFDETYDARHIKRAIERRIQVPLSKLLGSQQLSDGDNVIVDHSGNEVFDFYVERRPPEVLTFDSVRGE